MPKGPFHAGYVSARSVEFERDRHCAKLTSDPEQMEEALSLGVGHPRRKNPALRREVCITSWNAFGLANCQLPIASCCSTDIFPADRVPDWSWLPWQRAVCGIPAPPRLVRSAERSVRPAWRPSGA